MKISIIGIGKVGTSLAYTLVLQGNGSEIVLVGRNREVAEAEAADLRHSNSFHPHRQTIRAGALADTGGSQVIVLCSARPPEGPITSRMDYIKTNSPLFGEIVPVLAKGSPDALFLVITNPVDVMTYLTIKLGNLDPSKVLGTGTLVDCARFRILLSERLEVHPDDIRAYILGEHGDSQVPAAMAAVAGGGRVLNHRELWKISKQAVAEGHGVFRGKGHTNFAIARAAALMISAIEGDTRATTPASVLVDGFLGVRDVCLSLPVVLGRQGISRVLHPHLSPGEKTAFRKSAALVKEYTQQALVDLGKSF